VGFFPSSTVVVVLQGEFSSLATISSLLRLKSISTPRRQQDELVEQIPRDVRSARRELAPVDAGDAVDA